MRSDGFLEARSKRKARRVWRHRRDRQRHQSAQGRADEDRLIDPQLVERISEQAATAAFGVALQLWTYVQMPAMALGAAVSAMVAQNIGAGLWDRVGRITRVGIVQSLLITGGLIVLMMIGGGSAGTAGPLY